MSIYMKHFKIIVFISLIHFLIFPLSSCIKTDAEKISGLIKEGKNAFSKGHYQLAIAKWESAIEIDKNHPLAYYHLSKAYTKLVDYSNAIKYIQKAIQLSDDIRPYRSYLIKLFIWSK